MELPTELLIKVLHYIPLHKLRNLTKNVCKLWEKCTREVMEQKLKLISISLNEFGSSISDQDKLKSIFDESSERDSSSDTEKFTAWLLGNFDHPNESQVVSGIQLVLSDHSSENGYLVFTPTGKSNFGMFIHDLGYIPITTPYNMNYFTFSNNINPGLRFWFHVASSVQNSHLLKECNSEIPAGQNQLISKVGNHNLQLKDCRGTIGTLCYEIHGVKAPPSNSMTTSQLVGSQLLEFLRSEEQKVVGCIKKLEVNPQVLFSYPL